MRNGILLTIVGALLLLGVAAEPALAQERPPGDSAEARELREALRSAEDLMITDAEVDAILAEAASPRQPVASALSFNQLRDVLTSGRFRQVEEGRFFVLLSLAEAEVGAGRKPPPAVSLSLAALRSRGAVFR